MRKDIWDLIWYARLSQRYHGRREAFFERWRKATAMIGILGGSAAFAAVADDFPMWLSTTGAVAVVLASTIDLVVGTGVLAHRHAALRRRCYELEQAIVRSPEPSDADLREWEAAKIGIESDEPPFYAALALLCENELHLAMNLPVRNKLTTWQARTAQWFRHSDCQANDEARRQEEERLKAKATGSA
ncbi:hypothetical protein [Coralloluteibacterium thermophilus]|uniref:SLATT domain-containing protein n=1 Tax=Coralloluteibacterium thermophilum TaxID=2707049 RepID=A0ABV9NK71_9GAMM